jgi:hypothetical protein
MLAAMACIGFAHATAAPAADPPPVQLPDLVADPPLFPRLEVYTAGGDSRLLLRFDGFLHNQGWGAADIRGSARNGTDMTQVKQRKYRTDGTWVEESLPAAATLRYEPGDGHRHWHLGEAAEYSLWNSTKTARVAPAQKVGFCFLDFEGPREDRGVDDPVYTEDDIRFCEQDAPLTPSVYMGISAGWRDIYQGTLAFQWVDVSDVRPGSYWLRTDVDPKDFVDETNEVNAPAYTASAQVIPGYVASALVKDGLEQGEPAVLTLGATSFGSPGAVQYRIESAPAHGTLNKPTGTWFSGANVEYTPDPGYEGSDSFSYSARDSTSQFPLNPAVATASLGVQRTKAEQVAISGAPSQLYTGTSAQLQTTTQNTPPQVTWRVDGVVGGSAAAGTITPGGLYTAPASPPPDGDATIRATGTYGAFAEVEVDVVKAPAPAPSPSPPTGPGGDHDHGPGTPPHTHPDPSDPQPPAPPLLPPLLSDPLVSAQGRLVMVQTTPGRGGRVETKATVGRRRIGICRTKVPARQASVCRLTVARRYRLSSVLLVVKLRVGDKAVATKRARVPVRR